MFMYCGGILNVWVGEGVGEMWGVIDVGWGLKGVMEKFVWG